MKPQQDIGTAGERLRAMRELMKLERPDFAGLVGLTQTSLANVELGKQRMNEDHFEKVLRVLPHFTLWLTIGGDIDLDGLAASPINACKIAALRLQLGDVPEGYGMERFKAPAEAHG